MPEYRIFLHSVDDTAGDYYRVQLPYRHCRDILLKDGIRLTVSKFLDMSEDYDCYIFKRAPAPSIFSLLIQLANAGKMIVWDMDDNLFKVPDWSPVKKGITLEVTNDLKMALKVATAITVSTARLGEELGHPRKTVVLPNLIDANDYDPDLIVPNDNTPGIILWTGSITHRGDLEQVIPAVSQVRTIHADAYRFVFFGDFPSSLDPGQATHVGQVPTPHYPGVLSLLRPTIALAPLQDHPFNVGKSNIRYLEMTLAGAAVIASSVGPYADVIDDGKDGILVTPGDSRDWAEAILSLIVDPHKAQDMVATAYEKVTSQYSWHSEARNIWLNFFRSLPVHHRGSPTPTKPPDQEVGRSESES